MKPETTEDILAIMSGYLASAALGAAMELGVFWLLAKTPMPLADVAQSIGIATNRCRHWLEILCRLGLLEEGAEGYMATRLARETIVNALSQDSWVFQACEERASARLVQDLALRIRQPMSAWRDTDLAPPDYFQLLQQDSDHAARFTRKLYEIHLQLADQVAGTLDMQGVHSLLDLGGGSGVVSLALLRKWPGLTSVVVDVENVCLAGRQIAAENKLDNRIQYLAADFLEDDLPSGFDMVMLCDVSIFERTLVAKIHDALNADGQLVIVEKFAPHRNSPPPSRLPSAFMDALLHPDQPIEFTTAEEVQARLQDACFGDFFLSPVPLQNHLPWNVDWWMLMARKQLPVS